MGLKILLVEDDDVDVMTARRALDRAGVDHALRVHQDGNEALAALRRAAGGAEPLPDLIVLDLNLPRLSGTELLEKVKQDPALAAIPTVVLTTSGYERDVARACALGAAGYFVKPVEFEEYVAVMGTLCSYWALSARPD